MLISWFFIIGYNRLVFILYIILLTRALMIKITRVFASFFLKIV